MAIRASTDQLFGKPVPPRDDLLPAVSINETFPPPRQTHAHTHTHNSPTSRLETKPTEKDQTPDGTTFTSCYTIITRTIFTDYCLDTLKNGKSLPTALPTIISRLLRRSTRRAVSTQLSRFYQRDDTN